MKFALFTFSTLVLFLSCGYGQSFLSGAARNEVIIPGVEHVQVLQDVTATDAIVQGRQFNLKRGFVLPVIQRDSGTTTCLLSLPDGTDTSIRIPVDHLQGISEESLPPVVAIADLYSVGSNNEARAQLAQACQRFPTNKFFKALLASEQAVIQATTNLQNSSTQLQEAQRIRKNAEIIDKPNLLNPSDDSGRRRAQSERQRADAIEKMVKEETTSARNVAAEQGKIMAKLSEEVLKLSQSRAKQISEMPDRIRQAQIAAVSAANQDRQIAEIQQKQVDAQRQQEAQQKQQQLASIEKSKRLTQNKSRETIYEEFNRKQADKFLSYQQSASSISRTLAKYEFLRMYMERGHRFTMEE